MSRLLDMCRSVEKTRMIGNQAFLIFIAIFWGAMLGSAGRYSPFDTAASFFAPWIHQRSILARHRFWVSTLVLNVLPIIYLLAGYTALNNAKGIPGIVGAAVMSPGIFGCIRVLHAIMATNQTHAYFFSDKDWEKLKGDRHDNEHRFAAHFIPGIIYMVVYFLVGFFIAKL